MLTSHRARRSGLTLLEVLVALATCGLLAAAIARVLDRQQRFHHGLHAVVERRTHLRDATDILAAALRDAAPAEGDLLAIADTAVELQATVGSGVACAIPPARDAIVLAPDSVAAGHRFAAFRTSPQADDIALVLDDGPTPAASDDRWTAHRVAGVSGAAGGCAGSPLVDPALDAGRSARVLHLAPGDTLGSGVRAGAPVRVARQARFRLYRAGTGEWFLGREDWSGAGWTTIQPAAGPFRPGGPARGLAFRWLDAAGATLGAGDELRVRRVAVEARTRTPGDIRIDGMRRGRHDDSLRSALALRNVP